MHRTLLTLTLALTVAAVAAPTAAAKTRVVDDDNGCVDKQYSTIQAGVDAANPGDTVAVCPGFYNEYVQIQKAKLKVISRVRYAAVIQAPPGQNAVYTDGAGVLFRGFTVKRDPARVDCDYALVTFNWATIDYNHFTDTSCPDPADRGGEAILIDAFIDAGTTTVANNEIDDFGTFGIRQLTAAGLVRIQNNHIHDSGNDIASGIDFDCCVAKILSNTVEDVAGIGIGADAFEEGGFNVQIAGNRVRDNVYGIVTSGINIGVGDGSPRVKVERNRVTGNAVYGLWHDGSGPAYFKENTALGNFGLDCFDSGGSSSGATWTRNIGETDSPSNICRPPD